MTRAALVLVALAAACGDDSGATPDARAGSDAGADAAPTQTITASVTWHYLSPTRGERVLAPDLSHATVDGYTAGGSQLAGSGSSAMLTFPVDANATSWRWSVAYSAGTAYSFVSTHTAINAAAYFLGRPDAVVPAQSTETTFAVSGMTPWVATDRLDLFTPGNGGLYTYASTFELTGLHAGDTTLGQTIDWAELAIPLTDASKGDRLDVLHQVRVTDGGLTYNALTDVAEVTDAMQVDGQPSTITAAFAPVTRDKTVAFDMHTTEYAALQDQTGVPATTHGFADLVVSALPQVSEHGLYTNVSPTLAEWSSTTLNGAGTLTYGDPFTSGATAWDEFVGAYYTWQGTMTVGSMEATVPVQFQTVVPIADAGTFAPTLSPPQNVTINGQPAMGTGVFAGMSTTPELAWDPPASGTPTAYLVELYSGGFFFGVAQAQLAATFETTGTSLLIPEGFLDPTGTYAIVVLAVHSADDFDGAPFLTTPGWQQAPAMTETFTP